MFLCGDDDAVQAATQQFQRRSPLEVRIVRPADVQATWQLREDAAESVTAPALGGLLLSYLPAEECDAPNLMQHILEGRQEPLRPRSAAQRHSDRRDAVDRGRDLAGSTLASSGQLGDDAGRARRPGCPRRPARPSCGSTCRPSEAKLDQLNQLASKLPPGLGDDAIRRLGACMPGDVWLSQLIVTDRTQAHLQGASYLEAGVYDFVHWLEQAPGFKEVALKRHQRHDQRVGPDHQLRTGADLGRDYRSGNPGGPP